MKVTRGFATRLVLVVVVSWGFGGLPRAGASDNREPAGSSTIGKTIAVAESGGGSGPSQIINGADAPPGLVPFQVSVQVQAMRYSAFAQWSSTAVPGWTELAINGSSRIKHTCGGTLIAARWVLTAAHCLTSGMALLAPMAMVHRAEDLKVLIGTTELVDESGANPVGELIDVSEVIVHPWWAQNYFDAEAANVHPAQVSVADYRYDIALLRLATPASSTPVMLGTEAYAPPGATGTITGWGQDENGEYPIHLKMAAVPIRTDGVCVGAGVLHWHGGNICIGTGDTAVTPHAACYGDSGGPLLVLLGHAWLQVGVASFGVLPCATYSAYWSISRVWPWIFCNTGVAPLGHGALPLCPSTRLPTHSVYAPLDPSRP